MVTADGIISLIGLFAGPNAVAVENSGNIYLASYELAEVLKVSRGGTAFRHGAVVEFFEYALRSGDRFACNLLLCGNALPRTTSYYHCRRI